MADIFDTPLGSLRMILDSEVDTDSPITETLMDGFRVRGESILVLGFSTGVTGTLTSDPTNDTTGDAVDTAAGFTDDQHNGRSLVFTDGNAKGNIYTIDDTVAADNAVYCTGDNLYSDGARSGDAYEIFYDLLANTDGHDHDGVNSRQVVLADAGVGAKKLEDTALQMVVFTYLGDDELSHSGDTDYSKVAEFYIWLPTNVDGIKIAACTKTSNSSHNANCRVKIDSTYTASVARGETTYAWGESSAVDFSGEAGSGYAAEVELKIADGSSTAYLQGLSICFLAS